MRLSPRLSWGCRLKEAFLLRNSRLRLILIIPQIWQVWCYVWKSHAWKRDKMNFISLLQNRNQGKCVAVKLKKKREKESILVVKYSGCKPRVVFSFILMYNHLRFLFCNSWTYSCINQNNVDESRNLFNKHLDENIRENM